MNVYILNKLEVKNNVMEVLYLSDDYKSVINFMHDYIQENYDNVDNCIYMKEKNRIFQYKRNIGYVYNDKEIMHILQICEYEN